MQCRAVSCADCWGVLHSPRCRPPYSVPVGFRTCTHLLDTRTFTPSDRVSVHDHQRAEEETEVIHQISTQLDEQIFFPSERSTVHDLD